MSEEGDLCEYTRVRVRRDVYDWMLEAADRYMINAAELSRRAYRKWFRLHRGKGMQVVPQGPCGRNDPNLRVTKEQAKELAGIEEGGTAAANLSGILFWYLTEHDKGEMHPRHPMNTRISDEPYMEDEDAEE